MSKCQYAKTENKMVDIYILECGHAHSLKQTMSLAVGCKHCQMLSTLAQMFTHGLVQV